MHIRTGLYVGLMSGTSLDSIDATLIDVSKHFINLVATHSRQIPATLRDSLLTLCTPGANEIDRMGKADRLLGIEFGQACLDLLSEAGEPTQRIIAVGSHGQTVRHNPPSLGKGTPYTLQLADPNTIAQMTGITTVADFRRRDIAEGGEGAPLVPAFHEHLFASNSEERVILNIGGMANATLLIPGAPTRGFDTGPGNVLMDHWIAKHLNKPLDDKGAWAAQGNADPELLADLRAHPYFSLPIPKSTGRETFNAAWLQSIVNQHPDVSPVDVQATLMDLTVTSIAEHLTRYCPGRYTTYICGGGALNQRLVTRLSECLAPNAVDTTSALGIPPKWLEATAFAWLAARTLAGLAGNLPNVTGAHRNAILGGIYSA